MYNEYKMEELLPLVADLTNKYTSGESTSIPYEKAEQLMGAVLYCINEALKSHTGTTLQATRLSAADAYRLGLQLTVQKVKAALSLYNELQADFDSYNNHCLHDTFQKGLPAFFKWYDVRFAPQDKILTLDYPVLADLTSFNGIDAIEGFLHCLWAEQRFLNRLERPYVLSCLTEYAACYTEMIDNLCVPVYADFIKHRLIGKNLSETTFTNTERSRLAFLLTNTPVASLEKTVRQFTLEFVHNYYPGEESIADYLLLSAHDVLVRLKL